MKSNTWMACKILKIGMRNYDLKLQCTQVELLDVLYLDVHGTYVLKI